MLFVGINPGMRSAALGHHFAGYSNRFWKLLRDAELVPAHVGYAQDAELPDHGLGITNLVARATPGVADLRPEDYEAGRKRLLDTIERLRPDIVALVGVTVYRRLYDHRGVVQLGPQADVLCGARVFVLPNPSGRNAHHSYGAMLRAFRMLKNELGARGGTIRRERAGARALDHRPAAGRRGLAGRRSAR